MKQLTLSALVLAVASTMIAAPQANSKKAAPVPAAIPAGPTVLTNSKAPAAKEAVKEVAKSKVKNKDAKEKAVTETHK